jgi:hypothetical protein
MVERLRDVLDNKKRPLGIRTVCPSRRGAQNSIIIAARVLIIYDRAKKCYYHNYVYFQLKIKEVILRHDQILRFFV